MTTRAKTQHELTPETGSGPKTPKGKIAVLLDLLRQPDGTTIEQMMAATGWQAHSVRGAMSGSIKTVRGIAVISEKSETGRVYRIAETAA